MVYNFLLQRWKVQSDIAWEMSINVGDMDLLTIDGQSSEMDFGDDYRAIIFTCKLAILIVC